MAGGTHMGRYTYKETCHCGDGRKSTGNRVNTTAITDGAMWALELPNGTLCNVREHLASVLVHQKLMQNSVEC